MTSATSAILSYIRPVLHRPCVPPEPETAGTEKEELRASTEEVFSSKRKGSMSLPYRKTKLWMLENDYTVKLTLEQYCQIF